MKLNAIRRLHRFMGKEQKEALINGFIFSNFNYCPLVWHFYPCMSSQKNRKDTTPLSKNYLQWLL